MNILTISTQKNVYMRLAAHENREKELLKKESEARVARGELTLEPQGVGFDRYFCRGCERCGVSR